MTSPDDLESPKYILELRFDVAQVTETLQYNLIDINNQPHKKASHGRVAGTYNFNHGDKVKIRIIATAELEKPGQQDYVLNMSITDCTLVCIKPFGEKDLSIFDPHNACNFITEWEPTQHSIVKDDDTFQTTIIESTEYLVVRSNDGNWKMSGYLSVRVDVGKGPESRFYYFDPEASAGGGAGFGPK